MRVSAGFLLSGLSGKTRIHRARALDVAGERDTRRFELAGGHPAAVGGLEAEVAERKDEPRHAVPRRRPLWHLRKLDLLRCEHDVSVPSGAQTPRAAFCCSSSLRVRISPRKTHTLTPMTP
jgi:hypothetical protein